MCPCALLDNFSVAEENDVVGYALGLNNIMGDHDDGDVFAQRDDEVFYGAGRDGVNRGCGLVQQ